MAAFVVWTCVCFLGTLVIVSGTAATTASFVSFVAETRPGAAAAHRFQEFGTTPTTGGQRNPSFRFRQPRAPRRSATNGDTTTPTTNPAATAEELESFRKRNEQWVVLVDDEESIRFAVGDFLYDWGYEVTACADADSLLELIVSRNEGEGGTGAQGDCESNNNKNTQHRLPDIVISDVRMPESDKNGYELVEFLRSADTSIPAATTSSKSSSSEPMVALNQRSLVSLKNVPIVLLTAKAMTEDRIRGYQAGADVVLPKPFSPEELVSIIDGLIERNKRWLLPRKTRRSSSPVLPPSSEEFRLLKQELDEIKAIMKQNAANTVRKTDVVLNDKERTIVRLLSEGYTPREIAAETRPQKAADAPATVEESRGIKKILEGLLETTDTDSKTELVRWARKVGYIT
mmetsp:Transcript_12594/g.26667  ORF Transcript_12594/g.26667 Transcript_12594/m.26667 type:complete len:402 (-) Transcript_12594:214-1419(-)